MTEQHPFKWCHFQAEIMLLCIRWYVRHSLSYRDLEEIMWGVGPSGRSHHHLSVGAVLCSRVGEALSASSASVTTDSWRTDETYVKVKGMWMCIGRWIRKETLWSFI